MAQPPSRAHLCRREALGHILDLSHRTVSPHHITWPASSLGHSCHSSLSSWGSRPRTTTLSSCHSLTAWLEGVRHQIRPLTLLSSKPHTKWVLISPVWNRSLKLGEVSVHPHTCCLAAWLGLQAQTIHKHLVRPSQAQILTRFLQSPSWRPSALGPPTICPVPSPASSPLEDRSTAFWETPQSQHTDTPPASRWA